MKRAVVVFVSAGLLMASAEAQQPPPDDTQITLTYGELNALVQARVADALAGAAMRHLNEQLTPKKAAEVPAIVGVPGRKLPPPSPMPTPTP
jgi:hypothetical protein